MSLTGIQSGSASLVPYSGKFSWVQIFAECLQTLQKKFSWFLFSWGVPAVPHPWYVRTYTTSRDTRWVKNFVVFIFAVPCGQRKPRKFAPHENFPLYGISQPVHVLLGFFWFFVFQVFCALYGVTTRLLSRI